MKVRFVHTHGMAHKLGIVLFGLFIVIGLLVSFNGKARASEVRTPNNAYPRNHLIAGELAADSVQSGSLQTGATGQLTGIITSTIHLPLVQLGYITQRQLGTANLLSGPTACDGQNCYQLRVTCPKVGQTDDITLKVGEPISSNFTGTIIFASGFDGAYYWAYGGNNVDIVQHLREAGYRTVQMKWVNNWIKSQLGTATGIANLACRPATVAQWVYDNFHAPATNLPYCAVGHSNGASQIGYSVTQYGQSDLFTAVIFESGPNWSRVDTACLHDDPANTALYAPPFERKFVDLSYGFNSDGTGACAMMDASYRPSFKSDSLTLGSWSYTYPNLNVGFLFGGLDTTSTAAQGMYYHDLLVSSGTPGVTMTVVANSGHDVTGTPEGAQAMENTILNLCQ